MIQGLISGDVNKAVANASAPYIANEIAKQIPKENKEGRIIAHGIANVALALAKGENAGAQSLGAMTGEAVGMLAVELYGKTVGELTEDEKATVSAFASLAAGIAGGLVGGDTSSAANAAEAGKTTVENNYLSDSEHRQKTSLELKEKQGKITEAEQQKLAELRIKDTETTQKLLDTCAGGVSPECTAARKDAFETIDTYVSLTYQNPKTAQAGYQEIERLLNSTSPEAQQAFNLLEAYTEAFKNFGYTDEEARTRAGVYVGSIYVFGGMSAIANSGALVKQFGKDVAKPGVTPTKPNEQIPPKTMPNQSHGDKLNNYQVHDLKQVNDPALNLDAVRNATQQYLKKSSQQDGAAVSYATASVTANGKTEYYLSVSGKSWSGKSPDTVKIDGINYKVIRDDNNSFTSVGNIDSKKTNFNHAEQKLFNHIQDAYNGQKADVNMAIQNTSSRDPGMCVSCGYTSQNFAENNKNLNVNIYQGSTGKNK
ncbi:VENN motif pre-toxin domain-containing protein [Providencia rettgeri]